MSSRNTLKYTTSINTPGTAQDGDEYYNPTTGKLYKNVVVNGTTLTFVEIPVANKPVNITDSTPSYNTSTGALTVAGGVGIGGDINFGGSLYQNGALFTSGGGYINLTMPGTVTSPFSGTARFYPPAAISISMVYANLGSNPSSGNLNFVIKKNGISIGTTFSMSSALMTPVSISVLLTTSDYLTLDVSGSNASDLNVKLRYTYT